MLLLCLNMFSLIYSDSREHDKALLIPLLLEKSNNKMPLAEDEWEEIDDVHENGSRMEGYAWVDENGSRMEGDTWMDDNGSRMDGDTWETDSSPEDDMICMENEHCPDGFPVCFLGPYAEVVNAKDTGVALTGMTNIMQSVHQ